MTKETNLNIRISPDMKARIQAAADASDVSVSAFVLMAVSKQLKEETMNHLTIEQIKRIEVLDPLLDEAQARYERNLELAKSYPTRDQRELAIAFAESTYQRDQDAAHAAYDMSLRR